MRLRIPYAAKVPWQPYTRNHKQRLAHDMRAVDRLSTGLRRFYMAAVAQST